MTSDTARVTGLPDLQAPRYIDADATITTTHGAIEDEVEEGWIAGWIAGCSAMAERTAELDACWRQVGGIRREERIARDLAAMEECARRFHERHGTQPWPGRFPTTAERVAAAEPPLAQQETGTR